MPHSNPIANIRNETIGKLAVGNHIVKIGSSHGAMANLATTEEKPTFTKHSIPVLIRQPPGENLLDRTESIKEAIAALKSRQSVELLSPTGFGKSSLLRCLAYEPQIISAFVDGVISLSPIHPYVGDILQSLWEAFYESDISYKPTDNEIRQQIQNKQALILLDDNKLIEEEVEHLRNIASRCTFLIASSSKRRIQRQGRAIILSGLSIKDAITLMEGELQRSFRAEELPAARSLCTILKGHPLHLRIAIAYMQEERRSLAEIISQLPTSEPGKYLIEQIVKSLTETQRIILDLLAVMGGVGLDSEQVKNITNQQNYLGILEYLRRRHLVQFAGSRYSTSNTIIEILPPEWKLTAPIDSAINYFVNWAEKHQKQPKNLLLEIDAIAQILEVAVRCSRWQEVLRLVKAVEGPLALSKRWGLWEQVLQRGLQASQAVRDQASEAWALHQLGTRALCFEQNSTASTYLARAIQLRKSLGDETAVAATRHNFNLLPPEPQHHPPSALSVEEHQKALGNDNVTINPFETRDPVNSQKQSTGMATPPAEPKQKMTSPVVPDSKNGHQSTDNNQHIAKDINPQLPSPSPLVKRLNVITKNPPSYYNPYQQNFLLSPKGLITTGILASGGLLAWFNWHRFIPASTEPSTSEPKANTKPSPTTKSEPKAITTFSPIAKPTPTATATLSPYTQITPRIDPALTPTFPEPTIIKPKPSTSSKPPVSAPLPNYSPKPIYTPEPTPTAEATPTPTFTPTLTPTFEPPTPENSPTPTPTFTPSPTTIPEQSNLELAPKPDFTPPTPEGTPKAETMSPAPAITVTPLQESFNQQ